MLKCYAAWRLVSYRRYWTTCRSHCKGGRQVF